MTTEFEQELNVDLVDENRNDPQYVQAAADIAAETAMELASGDRPAWLPPNFTKPEALVESYREAQNKIREQGTELNTLRQQVEEMTAYVQPAMNPEAVQYGERISQLAQHDPAAMLALTAAQADRQARLALGAQFPELAARANQTVSVAAGLEAGFQTAASQLPEMAGALPQMTAWIAEHPDVQAQLAQTADPAAAAATWTNIFHATRETVQQSQETQAELARRMKLQAQTAVGAGGRPDPVSSDQQEWAKIAAARPAKYWSNT